MVGGVGATGTMNVVADDARTVLDGAEPESPYGLDPEADRVSRRRAKRWVWAAVIVGLVAIVGMTYAGRQSESDITPAPKAFCQAANRYEKELTRQQIAYKRDLARQIVYVEDIAATAPRAVRADSDTFLRSLRDLQAARTTKARDALRDDPEIERAVDNVNRYWNQGCGVFDRKSGI